MRGSTGKRSRRSVAAIVALLCLALAAYGAVGATGKKKGKGKGLPTGPYPALGACTVFPPSPLPLGSPAGADQSAWNQDISTSPVDPNSAAYMGVIGSKGNIHPDFGSPREYGIPYAVVNGGGPKTRIKFTAYGDESTRGPYRVPLGAPVEGGKSSDGDRHVIAIDTRRCALQELYRAFPKKKPKPRWNADGAVIWNLASPALRTEGFTSADAAGLPIFPGLARFDEAATGVINHALRVTFASTQNAWINPASHCAGDTPNPAAPPMGLRLRLAASYDVSAITGPARAIADAMKRYGLIVADNGSDWFVSGASDRRWPDDNLSQLKGIPGSAFEVVQSAAAVHRC